MRLLLLFTILLSFALPASAQDVDFYDECDRDILDSQLDRISDFATGAKVLETTEEVLAMMAEIRHVLSAAVANCTGGTYIGGPQSKVYGPIDIEAGVYILELQTDTGSIDISALDDGRCNAFIFNHDEGEIVQEIFEVRDDCRALMEIDTDSDWALRFEAVE